MESVSFSRCLKSIEEIAKKLGPKEGEYPFTAERFLVVLLDQVYHKTVEDPNEEMKPVLKMLCDAFPDVQKAHFLMKTYLLDETALTYLDDLNMKKRVREAELKAKNANAGEITVETLLHLVLQAPSDTMKKAMEPPAAAPAEEKKEPVQPTPEGTKTKTESGSGAEGRGSSSEAQGAATGGTVKNEVASLVSEVKNIRARLQNRIFGQDNAINVFVTGYFQARIRAMTDRERTRPRATFLFAGPPGVGKTYLAESAAEILGLPFERFDMSEYSDKEAACEFTGSDGVFRNSKSGNFTTYVSKHPECVILFDEIEKAHISIIHLFLQILDAGRIRDSKTDMEIPLKDTILIFTTNAGKQLYENSDTKDLSGYSRKVILDALQKDKNPQTKNPYFPGAICSRFASGNVVMFNHMAASSLCTISRKEMERNAEKIRKEIGISFSIHSHTYAALLLSEGSAADARTVKSRTETFFNEELFELLRLIESDKVKTGVDLLENVRIEPDFTEATEEVKALFEKDGPGSLLVFAGEEAVSACSRRLPGWKVFGADSVENAVQYLQKNQVDFVFLDLKSGMEDGTLSALNIEDMDSAARDFYKFLQESKSDLAVYLLETGEHTLSDEETVSLMRQGFRGVMKLSETEEIFVERVQGVATELHQQKSLAKLEGENKLLTFETAQTVSEDGRSAHIRLYDFRMTVAVNSEDRSDVLLSKPNVRFDDVIGAGEAKKELAYFVSYLKNPERYMGTGVKAPKGVILYGPPGTGKTMLAKAMACEAGVTFLAAEGNRFLKTYVGEGPAEVHKLFRTARKYAPSILFIDEIDAIARERGGSNGSTAGMEATLTAFLTEMDGFANDPAKPVFVLAATNFDVEPGSDRSLDPALMRRFDRRVYMDLPNREDRERFLIKRLAKYPAMQVSSEERASIAMRSVGMSLADLDSVLELALRSAIREGSTVVTDSVLEEAFETFHSGEEKKWDASLLERTARHEAGHALVYWLNGETPSYLTVVARGDHGGYMRHADREGKKVYTKDELLGLIRTSLAGRAAEMLYYGEQDGLATGASGDLEKATRIARRIVCRYGMDEAFGLTVVSEDSRLSEALSEQVFRSVNVILAEQMKETRRILGDHRDQLDRLVAELLSKNHMTGPEIEALLGKPQAGGTTKEG